MPTTSLHAVLFVRGWRTSWLPWEFVVLNFTVSIHITAQKHCPGGICSEVDLKQIKQPDVAVLIRQILVASPACKCIH